MGKRERRISEASRSYLIAYNLIQFAGWSFILMKGVQYMAGGNYGIYIGAPGLYETVRTELKLFQTLAILEVIHSMIGIVHSNVILTFFQVESRIVGLWGIIEAVPVSYVNHSIFALVVLLVWSITEVIRYIYYACLLIGSMPYIIIYLRYTLFYALYPVGVLGEQVLLFNSLPIFRASRKWSISLPNSWNFAFSYYYFVIVGVLQFVLVFPHLYRHMILQRRKVLFKTKEDTKILAQLN